MCWYDPIPDQLRNAPVLESMAYDSRMSKKPWKTKISLVEWNGQRDGTVFQALFSCGADHIPYSRLFSNGHLISYSEMRSRKLNLRCVWTVTQNKILFKICYTVNFVRLKWMAGDRV